MFATRIKTLLLACACVLATGSVARAQEDPLFDFIPAGGRILLEELRASGAEALIARATAEEGDADHWRAAIAESGAELDEWQAGTLAQYLALRAPLPAEGDLPRDGRDMAMALCQSCHIITVVITQDRTHTAWLGTMKSPSHIEIDMSEEERDLLAGYLVLNAGIPIDEVPVPLRAGGASY